MAESFIYSFNSVAPIFLLVLFGMFLKKVNFLNDSYCKIADKFVFSVALPLKIFNSVSGTELGIIFSKENANVMLFFTAGITLAFGCLCFLASAILKDRSKRGPFIQGAMRGNFAIFAITLAENMYGEAGKVAATPVLPVAVIMFNLLTVIAFEIFSPKDEKKKKGILYTVGNVAVSSVNNPLIIAIIVGIGVSVLRVNLGVDIPVFIKETVGDVAATAIPLALISIGVNFKRENLKGRIGIASIAALIKTAIMPAVMLFVAILLGFRGIPLTMILISFGSPTSVASYVMAKNMHGDYELAGQILLLTTTLSLATMFMFIFVLKQFAFI